MDLKFIRATYNIFSSLQVEITYVQSSFPFDLTTNNGIIIYTTMLICSGTCLVHALKETQNQYLFSEVLTIRVGLCTLGIYTETE